MTDEFAAHRPRMHAVAYRMLGSSAEADDAVQDAWLRAAGAQGTIENPAAWLTTVVSRLCLDRLRARAARREQELDERTEARPAADNPEREAALAESVGLALLVVMDRLAPAERVAFVLHDLQEMPFEEIAAVLERTPAAARQLASRARRRVRGAGPGAGAGAAGHRALVETFLAALRAGDVAGLLAVLDPNLVARLDAAAGGVAREVRGAENWVRGAVQFARWVGPGTVAALRVDGEPALVLAPGGRLQRVVRFRFAGGRIAGVDILADPATLRGLALTIEDGQV